MKIGIIGAMEEEVHILRDMLTHSKEQYIGGCQFITGFLESNHYCLNSFLTKVKPMPRWKPHCFCKNFALTYVINTGSAGGMESGCEIGDITLPEVLTYHDADSRALGFDLGQIPYMQKDFHPSPKLIRAVYLAANYHPDLTIRHGLHHTGDSFMAGDDQVAQLLTNFPEMVSVDMEATAIAQVCEMFEVPYVVIRSLSDIVGKDNNMSFEEFLPIAAKNSTELVCSFVKVLAHQSELLEEGETA